MYLGRITGDHSYQIFLALENTGNVPIRPADFADEPAIMTAPFHSIPEVESSNPYGVTSEGVASKWTTTNKRDWTFQPVLLNPHQQMKFWISFIPQPFDYNQKDFDPDKYDPDKDLRWRINVDGISDVPFIRDPNPAWFNPYSSGSFRQTRVPSTLTLLMFGCEINFSDNYLWIFLALGLLLYFGAFGRLLVTSADQRYSPYLLLLHSILLLFLSFAFAEIIVYVIAYHVQTLAHVSYPIVLVYLIYLFFLFHKKSHLPSGRKKPNRVSS